MGLYFFRIEYAGNEKIESCSGSLEANPDLENNKDFDGVIADLVSRIENIGNVKIGKNYKILCFNKI